MSPISPRGFANEPIVMVPGVLSSRSRRRTLLTVRLAGDCTQACPTNSTTSTDVVSAIEINTGYTTQRSSQRAAPGDSPNGSNTIAVKNAKKPSPAPPPVAGSAKTSPLNNTRHRPRTSGSSRTGASLAIPKPPHSTTTWDGRHPWACRAEVPTSSIDRGSAGLGTKPGDGPEAMGVGSPAARPLLNSLTCRVLRVVLDVAIRDD
ncbi:MAG: hypothetical protein JWL70_3163 [Acidimicrobiia bacterium]|nr:hypothetical protein [Acidimicrobiia bacterium]